MPALRNSAGAFDLPSIITGVVVVGILTAGVLAAIFGVIPFAQDNGAKQDLSSIRTAEGVAKAKDGRFMDHNGLLDIGYLQLSSTKTTKVKADEKGTCYVAIAKSGTGTVFFSTDTSTDPQVLEADSVTGCLAGEELAELVEDIGGIDFPEDTGMVRKLKLTALSSLEARGIWEPTKGADGYLVEFRIDDGQWAIHEANTPRTTSTIRALPEQTIAIRVTALIKGSTPIPSTATVTLPDSTLKNPGFEQGLSGWTLSGSTSTTSTATPFGTSALHTLGTISQVIQVPVSTPVLTVWYSKPYGVPVVSVGAQAIPAAPTAAVQGGWQQISADLSAYAGKTITLGFGKGIIDNIALQGPMEPSLPTGVIALSSSDRATVSWKAPIFSGGGIPVTSYTATAWSGTTPVSTIKVDDVLEATFTDLTNADSFTFTVSAHNMVGASASSAPYGPVKITSGPVKNPGFEQGLSGWTLSGSTSTTSTATPFGTSALHTLGTISQVIQVPVSTPVLTVWYSKPYGVTAVSVDGQAIPTAPTAAVQGGWQQISADLSAYAGKTITLRFSKGIIDEIAFNARG